jgi:hypothetical protein
LRDLKIQKHHHDMGHGDHVQRHKNSYLSDQWIQQVPMMIRSRSCSLACSEENQRNIQFCLCVSSTSLGKKTPWEFGLSLSYLVELGLSLSYLVELSKCVAYLEMSTM